MSIIYSYPTYATANGSDLLLASRFDEEPGGPARTINLSLDTIGSYISTNYASTLNQVLTNGNESLLNAKIGQLYLWDNPNNQYSTIRITDSAFIIEGIQGITGPLLQIEPGILNLKASGNFTGSLILSGLTDNRNYALPNKPGTIALTSDIPTTTNYGLATQLANSTPIANTITKSTLNGSSYAGTLSVPANGFSIGDSFNAYMMGHISNNNNVGLTITIETVAGVVLATTGLMTLAVSSNNHWTLDADFVIRAIGSTGTASIITAGSFSHSKSSNNNLETYNFISENTTTFDTTIANELVIKAQWGTASASNSIYSNVFILNKVY